MIATVLAQMHIQTIGQATKRWKNIETDVQNTKGTIHRLSHQIGSNVMNLYSSECQKMQVEVRIRPFLSNSSRIDKK